MKGYRFLWSVCFCLWPVFLFSQHARKKSEAPKKSVPEVPTLLSYELLPDGDTLNKLYSGNLKQGLWLEEHPAHFEEPAYYESGLYEQNKKSGKWLTFYPGGQLVSEENFRNGLRHGEARYYDEGRLICVGHYLALNAKYEYDTLQVERANDMGYKTVVVKTDVGSIRHGNWLYYDAYTRNIKRMMEYQADEVISDTTYNTPTHSDSLYMLQHVKQFPHVNPTATRTDWIDTKNRKKIKYTDFPDNATEIKPNIRKK